MKNPLKKNRAARGGRRSNVALGVAVVALVAATTGTAYAAVAARNSVVSSSIRNGEVKTADIAKGAVTGRRIKDASIKSADIAADGITTSDLAEGAVGASDLASIVVAEAWSSQVQDADGTSNGGAHGIADVPVTCPTGTKVISGGALWGGASDISNYDRNVYIQSSHLYGNGWRARGIVDFGANGNIRLRVQAYCLTTAIPVQ